MGLLLPDKRLPAGASPRCSRPAILSVGEGGGKMNPRQFLCNRIDACHEARARRVCEQYNADTRPARERHSDRIANLDWTPKGMMRSGVVAAASYALFYEETKEARDRYDRGMEKARGWRKALFALLGEPMPMDREGQ